MDKHKSNLIAIITTIIIFFILILSKGIILSTTNIDIESFYHINLIKSVQDNHFRVYNKGLFMFKDPSTQKDIIIHPLFYYSFGFINSIFHLEHLDYLDITYILHCLIAVIFYVISYTIIKKYLIDFVINKKLTKNLYYILIIIFSFFCSLIFFFVPYLFRRIILFNPIIIINILFILFFYFFSRDDKKSNIITYVIAILLTFSTAYSIYISLIILVYLIFKSMEGFDIKKRETDFAIFFFLVSFWFNLILFKKPIELHGVNIIWQNLPHTIVYNYFRQLNVISLVINIGVFLGLVSFICAYLKYFINKNKVEHLFFIDLFNLVVSGFIVSFLCALFGIVKFEDILMFVGMIFAYSIPFFIGEAIIYINRTKISKGKYLVVFSILIILLFNNIGSSYMLLKSKENVILKDDQIEELNKIKDIISRDIKGGECKAITLPEEGSLFYYFTSCKVVSNNNFLFVEYPNQLYENVNNIYKLYSLFDLLSLTEQYKIDYVYFSKHAEKKFGIDSPNVVKLEKDSECFKDIFNSRLFKIRCKLKKFVLEND